MTNRMTKTGVKADYARPKLVVYGEFSRLTAAGSGPLVEGINMMANMRRI